MGSSKPRPIQQFGALPYLIDNGQAKVMLITSRRSRSWLIPKGWPMGNKAPKKVASIEAYEEAGARGNVANKPIGSYSYTKRLYNGHAVACSVDVYPMRVTQELKDWPERGQRKRHWVTPKKAAKMVREPSLAKLISKLNKAKLVRAL